ncbi:MmpS family transport accessory protein [Segniliparus rugosus]|nr:MmpS family transport accessory protein [Segniliparus rugosus]
MRKLWIPAVIALVLVVAGTVDMRLHGVFGSDNKYANGGPPLEEPRNLHPKHLRYEIFGPAGTTASINYIDENANAQNVRVSTLPWSIEFTMNELTSALNVMAQGDSDYLGCRITINDELKDEYVTRMPFAQTYCEVRSA